LRKWGWFLGFSSSSTSAVLSGTKRSFGLRLQEDSTISYYVQSNSAFYNSFLHAITNEIDVQSGLNFFEQVAYRGAFDAATDWTAQWAAWGL